MAIRWPHTLLDVELSDREWDDAYAAIDRVFRDPRRVERAYWARACADRAVYNNATPPVDPDLELVAWGKWRVIMATAHFTYQSSAVEWSRSAHDYLDWAWRNGREWAVPTSWFPEDAVAGSRWLDDGSEPDPEQLAAFLGEVGDLRRPSQYVVVRGRPILQDFFAPSWTTIGQHPRATSRTTPLLLIDIDGCLSPYELDDLPEHYREVDFGLKDLPLSRQITSGLLDLADLYDLAWATTWEDSANAVALRAFDMPARCRSGASYVLRHVFPMS